MTTCGRRIRIQAEVGVLHRAIDPAPVRDPEHVRQAEIVAVAAELVEQRRGEGRHDAAAAADIVPDRFTLRVRQRGSVGKENVAFARLLRQPRPIFLKLDCIVVPRLEAASLQIGFQVLRERTARIEAIGVIRLA